MSPKECPAEDRDCPLFGNTNGWGEYKQYVLAGIADNKTAIQRVESKINQLFFALVGIGTAITASLITIAIK